MPHPRILDRDQSCLLVIDLQESYRDKLHHEQRVVDGTGRLLRAAELLGIPALLSEQYPKGLGGTRREITAWLPDGIRRFEKTSFSALGAPGLPEYLDTLARPQVVVTGIETHVCVSQTVHGLLERGMTPHIVRDAITSRFPLEDAEGYAKMIGSGAVPCSVEQVLFEWLVDSLSPDFKTVQKLVV